MAKPIKDSPSFENTRTYRSPFFYVGDKHKLMPQLREYFPKNIDIFFDPFCGGGSVSMNVRAKKYVLNDGNPYVMRIHKFLQENLKDDESMRKFKEHMADIADYYGLSMSGIKGTNDKLERLKRQYTKTYYAVYNKEGYTRMRQDYNDGGCEDDALLYMLVIYGFNHMIRFNTMGMFSVATGNLDWNSNVNDALDAYAKWCRKNEIILTDGMDFEELLRKATYGDNDFIYLDPPYCLAKSEYNKRWTKDDDRRLYHTLNELDACGVYWGISNLMKYRGEINYIFQGWYSDKHHGYDKHQSYYLYEIESNYISHYDNTNKKDDREMYVTNYIRDGRKRRNRPL